MDLFFKGLESLLNGNYFFHSGYEAELVRDLMQGLRDTLPKIKFAERELQVSIKLSKGLTARETADSLKLSVRTVEFYRTNLLKKTKTKNATELVAFLYENGIKVLGSS
jgi:DNA-binding NarL/FixJ family response regulator